MTRRLLAFLGAVLLVLPLLLVNPSKTTAAMDVAKQVLIGADYSNKDLRGATFNLSNLREANLSGSDLRGASLYGAKLQDADLSGTDLREATLDSAVLTGTDLSDAVLEGAFAFNTRFKDVTFRVRISPMSPCVETSSKVSASLPQAQIPRQVATPAPAWGAVELTIR